MDKIKIIVVDDSAFMRKAISDMIESEEGFEVVAKFRDGRELIEKVDKYDPDLITLDVQMKDLDGLSTLKQLKRLGKSYPVIMLSSATTEGSEITLECLDNGAISFVTKPSGSISLDIIKVQKNLIEQIKSITNSAKIKLATSKTRNNMIYETSYKNIDKEIYIRKEVSIDIPKNKKIDSVVIGASTGGPKALQEVLTKLPANLGVPVFVVQHMPEGFTKVFSERLNKSCNMRVVEADEGMKICKDTIYIAKGGRHMIVGTNNLIHLNQEPAIWGVRPAVDKLFNSATTVYGGNLLSVILTGMGKDGADGTKNIKDNGGITISEDKSTCTIYGMPKAAFETGKVDFVVPLDQIANKIIQITKGV
ncbi:protein-glutamate methylesterase/protein-glutamine glutaminase [Clostridium saccharobutylicum]|uniref:Protein-glutamate methylesterase/protein-glutamine glutaminase n=1 Tax=Clostridium saccharobutylicum DSM 13864 TaxID=1345695 RepID=U5MZL7_CLOSA|nr:chemotaxis response regulator protein-glutamate methylesterase [Clostridium saccharobutylicum]AGX44942.1 chemotaxis response regulator protein-glutamate methylesterase CheB [Clostridium saccharobutylicum DSM 13864]AQR92224.1 chemotaxis response regulator protein-glutamate methylesterase [Clostridium saccharobutylicum]AQS02126.1 chemotaxis response regulator protein-glutamate methylesterase [Clostridium saccharobutylicum]AQS11730.1 chemotaxis response regulator protein-glutamate methylesteras